MAKRKDDEFVEAATVEGPHPDPEPEPDGSPWKDAVHDGSIEVKIGDPPAESPKRPTHEELVAQIEAEQAARRAAETRANEVAALQQTLKGVLDRPAPVTPAPQPVQQPGETDEAFAERLKKDFFESPKSHLDEYARRTIAPLVGQISSGMQLLAREMLENGPEGESFKRYLPEIERIVEQRQDRWTNPRVYKEAFKQVQAEHITEIIAERVKAELEERERAETERPAPATFTERPGGAPRTQRREVVTLTREEAKKAAVLGLDPETYWRQKHNRW